MFLAELGGPDVVNIITGAGYSPLSLALHFYGDDDTNHDDQAKVIEYLQAWGAKIIQPGAVMGGAASST